MRWVTFLSALALMASASLAQSSEFVSGNWRGGSFYDQSGAFSHCAMSASYPGNTLFLFSINRSYAWNMASPIPTGICRWVRSFLFAITLTVAPCSTPGLSLSLRTKSVSSLPIRSICSRECARATLSTCKPRARITSSRCRARLAH